MADPNAVRRPTPDFNPQVGFNPNSNPAGSSFNPVLAPRTSSLDEGLRALMQLEPKLDAFMAKADKEQEEKDTAAGREAALKEALSYGDAVKQGKISPTQSKWFMKGYKSQYGETIGQQWALEAKTAWSEGEAKNSDDPEAAKKFIQNFIHTKLQDPASQDEDVRAGLLPLLRNTGSTIMAAQAEYQAKKVKETHLDNVGIAISNDIDLFRQGKMSRDQLLQSIQQRDSAGLLMGIDKEDMKKTLVAAFTEKAKVTGDASLLTTLKSIPFIGNNPKYAAAISSADLHITSKSAAEESRAFTRQQRARAEQERVGMLNIYDMLSAKSLKGEKIVPSAELYAAARATGNPQAFVAVNAFIDKMNENSQKDDPQVVKDAMLQVARGGPNAMQIAEDLIQSKINDKTNIATLISYARTAESFQNDRSFWGPAQEILNTGPKGMDGTPATVTRDAADKYQTMYLEFLNTNPKATESEKMKFAVEAKRMLVETLTPHMLGGGRVIGGGVSVDLPAILASSKTAEEALSKVPKPALQALTDEQLRAIYQHYGKPSPNQSKK